MRRFLITTVLLLFFMLKVHPIYFNRLGIKEGLSQLSVHAIYQDELGRMWFGTQEGISIYNGEEIINYKNFARLLDKPVNNYTVYNLTGTGKGDIFFTLGSLLIRYDLKMDRFHMEKENIASLLKIGDRIYFSSSDSIFYWNPLTQTIELQQATGIKKNITAFHFDSRDRVWAGTKKGLYRVGKTEKENRCVIPDKDISVLFESSRHDLWIGTRLNGLYRYGVNDSMTLFLANTTSHSISHNHIRAVTEDTSGNIWIGTFYGLNKYDPAKNHFSLYKKDHIRGSLSHSSVFSLFIDKQDNLWVGTYYGGVNYFNYKKNRFHFYADDPLRQECLNFPFTGQMAEDNERNLWICTEGGGLNKLDRQTGQFTYYTASKRGNALRHNNLKCIDYDSATNILYIGTYTGGLSRMDLHDGRFYNYIDHPSFKRHANISWLKIYGEYIVFVDDYGLFKIEKKTDRITPLFPGSDTSNFYGSRFIIDSHENLWLVRFNELLRIPLRNPLARQTFPIGEKGLGTAGISSILETSGQQLFIATAGAGIFLYDPQKEQFLNYNTEREQLLSDFCYTMVESPNGHLIISCDKGLFFLDPETGESISSASIEKDLPFSAFNQGCGIYRCKDDEIFVGSADGMISFHENDFIWNDTNYQLYFSKLFINHKEITPAGEPDILSILPAYTGKLTLSHDQNNLILGFASSNYLKSNNASIYEYKLEGFDPDWIPTHNTRLSYTNLPPGAYTLWVREKKQNFHPSKEIRMDIILLPPFYNTPLAWILYTVLFISLLYTFISFRQRQIRLKTSLEYERKEKDYITNLNKAKISFFANVSHEFRTPLSLMISQLELLLNNHTFLPAVKEKINKIYKTTFQMQNLISELLDFQKLEQKQADLYVSEQDLVPFLRNIHSFFEEKAQKNQIRYSFSPQTETIVCWFDPKQMRKVFTNLLSNAFKFTPVGGEIELFASVENDKIIIKVIDNGIGIEQKDLSNIFERYYQASNSMLSPRQEFSTGIGLALCKDIIELHHGKIQAESKVNYGSIFVVTLEMGKQHFEGDSHIKIQETGNLIGTLDRLLPQTNGMENSKGDLELPPLLKENKQPYKILLVEDNKELLETLNMLFSPFYSVLQATNGTEGLKMAQEEKPDLIVSDIMMPGMNGDRMCLELKQHIDTCHIPIVLLTALSSMENNIEGLLKGADDYITKPFHTKILLVKCNNLIRNRLLLQQKYRQEPACTLQLLASNETDRKMLQKIEAVIERHLGDPEFSIDKLAEEAAIGRRSLYNKFKQLTGMTPNDFILNYKLKRAASLLKNDPDLPVGEIADLLGFSSPRYFSRCFKNQFDLSPQDYRNNQETT